jgi:hypothetical protein
MTKAVYKAINAVQIALAKSGIAKDRQAQTYKFRGIDDVYNAISPLLGEHGLCILPRMIRRDCQERQTAKGSAIFYVIVEAEFDFVAAEDGSVHVVRTFGEAMDMSDKATNKAMSAAYKYAAMQAFAIPTEGDNDTENQNIEPVPINAPKPIGALPEEVFADYLIALKDAPNIDALKDVFGKAYTAAKQINDQASMDTFQKVYEKQKAALTGEQP